jgi:chlorobactene glucosyltransferase
LLYHIGLVSTYDIFLEILLYIQTATVVYFIVLLVITLFNLRYLRKLNSYSSPEKWPRFSVLIPARNEEDNISTCVSGLLKQDYPDFQVIVLDDNSEDKTWEILQEFVSNDRRIKIIKGQPLPSDWLGKHWACHQLAENADGEMLLFVDADTIHKPDMLRCAASAMIGEDAALISALPHQQVVTWSEMLSIPAVYLGMLCGVPMYLTKLQRNPLLFACLGQFLVFRREAYNASGGYAAVRQNVVDDLAIGRRVHAMGLHYKLLNGNGQVSCRMYRNFDQTWKGLTKSTFATFNFDPYFLVFMWLLVLIVFISPIVVLAIGLFQPGFPIQVTIIAGLGVILTLLLWSISNTRFHFPLYLVLLYPLSVLLMTSIALASMILTIQGKALWKGRTMPKTVKP